VGTIPAVVPQPSRSPLPRVRDSLRVEPLPDGEFAVLDGGGHRVLVVNEQGLFLLVRLDGLRPFEALAAEFAQTFGEAVDRTDVDGWAAELRDAGLLTDSAVAIDAVRYLNDQGVRYRRVAEGGERRSDDEAAAAFDWGVFLVNEGRLSDAAAAFAEHAAARPTDVRAAALSGHLQFLARRPEHGRQTDRRDPLWRAFDGALKAALESGECPRCQAPFAAELGHLNRCRRCGAGFTDHVLRAEEVT